MNTSILIPVLFLIGMAVGILIGRVMEIRHTMSVRRGQRVLPAYPPRWER